MRLAAVAFVALVGCGNSVGDDAPIYGGGGGGGGGGGASGGMDGSVQEDAADADATVTGRVCIVADARLLTTSCADTGADGVLVELSTYQARTTADGSFEITPGGDSATLWRVSSDTQSVPDIVPSVEQVSLNNIIPAFDTNAYETLLAANGAQQVTGTGAVFLRTTHAGAPLVGVEASTAQSNYMFYDNDESAVQWQTSAATSTNGVVWVPGLVPDGNGNAVIDLTPASGDLITATVKVFSGELTFATVEFP